MLVTEAYSARNLGDLELVERTLSYARSARASVEVVCLAVDPESFEIPGVSFFPKLFSRLDLRETRGSKRVQIYLAWAVRWITLSTLAFAPRRVQARSVRWLVRIGLLPSSAELYTRASSVIAVGGGYLGDQYFKETLLTVWTWWWASRLGVAVETMPVSVEIRSPFLGIIVRLTTRNVSWRARDSSTVDSLARLGVNAALVPDLAFANYCATAAESRVGSVLCLVGADYLSVVEQRELESTIVELVKNSLVPRPVRFLAMHRRIDSSNIGGDLAMSLSIVERLRNEGISTVSIVDARSYADVCNVCGSAEIVLSARMHAGIAALCRGARVGLLAYEEKHFALMRDMELERYVIDIRSKPQDYRELTARLFCSDHLEFHDGAARRFDKLCEERLLGR
ncbi:polysaccharide pyruvyl transferase family protein [Gordonia polyisoprenivorans]|uniref:polysaccharide pyruvyl transferase family protein n=1 Tax=Gordonia polyisoprenivorans TaxID=84595 RepID=UPI002B309988|nr:polysaccharide pyruvyl transferase family protein [Gordonia polyisoprenivorans]